MKVGVVSDSHGEIENLKRALSILLAEDMEKVIHLGDDYEDAGVIPEDKLIRVPGVFSEYYKDTSIPNRTIKNFEGWKVLITHTKDSHRNDLKDDIRPEELIKDKKVDVVLYGHTHIPSIEEEEGILLMNPGHLKSYDKKGYKPSLGVIEFEKDRVKASILDLGTATTLQEFSLEK